MAQSKKIRLLTTGVATILAAAALIGGGTLSYLKSETEDVVNEFNPNQVTVDLAETTDNDYEIIPGTTAEKDPKVTVNNTVDSYVYVVVTDNTDGLVDYKIAEGWKPLDGYEGVYYREVAADDEVKEFYVLEGNKVSYDATLENTHMVDEDGILKEGLALTFKAYAIQQASFDDAAAAFAAKDSVITNDNTEAKNAIAAGTPVVLTGDVTVDVDTLNGAGGADINLNGNKLTVSGDGDSVVVASGESLTLKNGNIEMTNIEDPNYAGLAVGEGSAVVLDNVDIDLGDGSILVDYGIETASIDVINSTITTDSYFAISTNALNTQTGQGVVINVINSNLIVDGQGDGDCTGILMNVPGRLTVTDSDITAGRQAVIVRTGNATITNSTLNNTLAYTEANWAKYDESKWGAGNEVPVAVLVVGDRSTSYPWDASCILNSVTLNYGKTTDRAPIYAAAYDGQTTTIDGVSPDVVTVSSDAGGVTVTP